MKLGDPCSFTIPISIENLSVGRAFLDLGSSINLMPLSHVNKIGKVAMKPTCMAIQLTNRSIKFPLGIVENMLVRVGRFTIVVDFAIMDIKEDHVFPLILGKPFMNTANVIINVAEGKCTLQVDDEELTFDVREAMKHPKDKGSCFKVDIIDEVIEEQTPQIVTPTPLKLSLTNVVEDLTPKHNEELGECIQHLDSSKEVLENKIEDPITLI